MGRALAILFLGFPAVLTNLVVVGPAAADRPPRGYIPRACGFDLDDDGVVGEPVDDCRLCDGITLDPDGDGVNEDLIYIDADSGDDTTGDGSPQEPYRTIQHAWSVAADGPADGAEDILCFCGTASEQNITPMVSGVPGVRVDARSGSEARDFELPRDPTMLVGWDRDRDGCYPPYDDGQTDVARCGTDADVAVLDGAGLDRAFELSRNTGELRNDGVSYLEMAHFAARDYGYQTPSGERIGFVSYGRGLESRYLYLHDLELDNINRGKRQKSGAIVFDFFIGEMEFSYAAMVNLAVRNVGSYFARGSFGNVGIEGPVRFQNIGYLAFGCSRDECGPTGNAATATGFKLWGVIDGLEVLDSDFDLNPSAWNPRPLGPNNGVVADACTQDWTVRNNHFRDWTHAFGVKGADGFCEVRPVDDVLFDANHVVVDDDHLSEGAFGVVLNRDGNSSPEASIADVTVVNNFFYSEFGWRRLLYSEAGNQLGEGLGTVVFAANTVHGFPAFGGWGIIYVVVGTESGTPLPYPLSRFRFENNIFTGLRSGSPNDRLVFNFEYEPSAELVIGRNTYDPLATFRWLGATYEDLAEWQTGVGLDPSSRSCVPELVSPETGDLHLVSSDSCARNMGGDISSYTLVDIDFEERPVDGSMSAGADEPVSTIFADGFESGDTSAWSSTIP